ncbi:MAG: alpha/beta hydrolase [Anaerolineae bacterium]
MTEPRHRDRSGSWFAFTRPDGTEQCIGSLEDWAAYRQGVLGSMRAVMGSLPQADAAVPLDVAILDDEDLGTVTRTRLTYTAEEGDRVPAYLLAPKARGGRGPAVLCLHQTTAIGKGEPAGIGGLPNLHYALELAERGYVTLTPDYPNFGDYVVNPYELGYASATMKGIWNHRRAIDLLQSLPTVDRERIGCIGHSLGGHNTIFLSVFDKRVKAAVSSCGFNSFHKYYGGNLAGWSHKGYMPRIATDYGADPRRMPFDFSDLVAALAPRPFFANAPLHDANFEVSGVQDCIRAALPVYGLFGAEERLVAVHPDAEHDFPPDTRLAAYAFLDRWLG